VTVTKEDYLPSTSTALCAEWAQHPKWWSQLWKHCWPRWWRKHSFTVSGMLFFPV